jgi:DNA repair exonuclease SbcCD ATPase subunit
MVRIQKQKRSAMSGQARGDRDWEHWPQERKLDDGIRHRLRGLFHPAGHADDVVEGFLAEHGRELETRAAQLAETIADLERREQRTTELRIAVEQMLRRGSVELDERHAELAELAARLAERESLAAETEKLLAERRTELGAVELRRAALERREAALGEREEALRQRDEELAVRETALADVEQRAAELVARSAEVAAREERLTRAADELERERTDHTNRGAELELRAQQVAQLVEQSREIDRSRAAVEARAAEVEAAQAAVARERDELRRAVGVLADALGFAPQASAPSTVPPTSPTDESSHLLLVPGERYRLVDVAGASPTQGTTVELDGASYVVARSGPSPLPTDRRRCVYLELGREER